jgi:glycerol-3-phosphate acyltransferase PlsX
MLGINNPKVGLLNMGEEEKKGTEVLQEAHQLLKQAPINFVGNVEGRDIMSDAADVVVTDGFTGNVALKTLEGALKFLVNAVFEAINSTDEAKAVSHILLDALAPAAAELDPDATGGAMLLGVEGVCIISHGSSSARAIVNAVRVAGEMVDGELVDRLRGVVAPT